MTEWIKCSDQLPDLCISKDELAILLGCVNFTMREHENDETYCPEILESLRLKIMQIMYPRKEKENA